MPSCLIVDDAKVVRMVARKIFQDLGFTVSEAENGAVALEVLQKETVDIVLLDWNMPVMDGMECLEKIREMILIRQPKVVMCTTENDMDKILTALGKGANEYIMKPFDSDILRSKLEQIGVL